MRLDTTVFLIDSFLFQQDKTFLQNAFKYFARVLQSYITQQALRNHNFDFNSIWSFSVLIYHKVCFYTKRQLCHLSLQWHLGNLCTPSGRWAMTVTVQGYFWHILQLSLVHEFPSAQNQPKMTLHSNCHSTAPRRATKVAKVPLQR